MTLIKDGSNVINQYLYVGQRRVSERKYVKASDGSTEVVTLHALYDGVGMITRWYHDKSDNSVVVGFQYGRDKVGNPNYELREHQSNNLRIISLTSGGEESSRRLWRNYG